MPISVVIVEDELEIRESLRVLIHGNPGYSCTDTFSDAESALDEIPSIRPDVVLMDIHLPHMSGIQCMQALKIQGVESEFLMSTSFDDPETIYAALSAGANGYLTKTTSPVRILEAIAEVHAGGSPMSSEIARKVVRHFQVKPVNHELNKLSLREQEILALLSDGYRYKEVGTKLFISTDTVRTHIRNIYSKLQVSSRTEAINKIKM